MNSGTLILTIEKRFITRINVNSRTNVNDGKMFYNKLRNKIQMDFSLFLAVCLQVDLQGCDIVS